MIIRILCLSYQPWAPTDIYTITEFD